VSQSVTATGCRHGFGGKVVVVKGAVVVVVAGALVVVAGIEVPHVTDGPGEDASERASV
jgi:hypothetical protein